MEDQYQTRIEECFKAYKDIILGQAAHPDDDDYDAWESQITYDLEMAIEEKVRRQLLVDITAYLSGELPF